MYKTTTKWERIREANAGAVLFSHVSMLALKPTESPVQYVPSLFAGG